mgnify:FL=1
MRQDILWLATANSDPARDTEISGGTLIVDARTKLPAGELNPQRFPNIVASSEQTIRLVDFRWADYGMGGFIPSPSAHYRRLLKSGKAEI